MPHTFKRNKPHQDLWSVGRHPLPLGTCHLHVTYRHEPHEAGKFRSASCNPHGQILELGDRHLKEKQSAMDALEIIVSKFEQSYGGRKGVERVEKGDKRSAVLREFTKRIGECNQLIEENRDADATNQIARSYRHKSYNASLVSFFFSLPLIEGDAFEIIMITHDGT
jgi:hypothetical protein